MVKSSLATALLLIGTITISPADEHSGGDGDSTGHGAGGHGAGHGAIIVESVISGSAAEAAGLQAGDNIVQLAGQEVTTWDGFQEILAAHEPGDTVSLGVRRKGEMVDLPLTFGERPDGGVSIGVRLQISMDPGADAAGESGEATTQCLDWIEKTYGIESMMEDLDLDLSDTYESMRTCVGRDTRRMGAANAIKYCDNVFKVHCSGLDLLTEIGEAHVQQCEGLLNDSMGLRLGQYKGWKTCAQHEVFDRYTLTGETSDAEACQALLLDDCGTNIDAVIETAGVSSEQRDFLECCSADAFGGHSGGDSGEQCPMIDDGFMRGPCHDQSVCVNRLTSEWIHCSVLE